jgi:Tol biopolymer transport system component
MSSDRDVNRIVRSWLDDGVTVLPERVLDAVLDQLSATPQRRPAWVARKLPLMNSGIVRFGLAAAAVVAIAVIGVSLQTGDGAASSGWVAFARWSSDPSAGLNPRDIYLVREGQTPHRIIGSDGDGLDQICPAFSSDGGRLAYGQAQGTESTGYRDAALVIADVDTSGNASETLQIKVGGTRPPPCANWSPDGRRVAFMTTPSNPGSLPVYVYDELWVATLGGDTRIVPGLSATDFEWSPDGSQLAIATGGAISLYAADNGDIRTLVGASGVTSLAWSPDGTRIAYQRIRTPGTPADAGTETQEIWIIGLDGSGRTLQTQPFQANHGIGPVWSPTGRWIAYQRICGTNPSLPAAPCREQHDVVLIPVDGELGGRAPGDHEVVLPRLQLPGSSTLWWPYRVTWSPDGKELLYTAWGEGISGALLAVPIGSPSRPVVLYEGGDISVYDGDGVVPIQTWGSRASSRTPTATPPPSPSAQPSPDSFGTEVHDGLLDPGTYAYLDVDHQGFNVSFTVPAGWVWNGRYLSKAGVVEPQGAAIFFFGGPVQVYADPCHWAGTQSNPPAGSSVQDLVAALAAQPMRNATTPVDRNMSSKRGMAVQLKVPDSIDFATCDQGQFRSWGPENKARSHEGPGQGDLVWVVDVTGNGVDRSGDEILIVDAATFGRSDPNVGLETNVILAGIYVGHWG